MFVKNDKVGLVLPDSNLAMADCFVPSFWASVSWLKPAFKRFLI